MEHLRIRLLGGLDVEGVDAHGLGSRKARTLLKVLALARGATVPTEKIIDVLWGDDDLPSRPADQVGVLASRLRRVVGTDRLTHVDGGWALRVDWLDLVELAARVAEVRTLIDAGSTAAARAVAAAGVTLARGELLPDEAGSLWLEPDRVAAARLVGQARTVAAEAAWAAGDAVQAAEWAQAVLDHDPYDEVALRLLMRCHVAVGRPASALAAYAATRRRLADELGVGPGRDTEALHTAILLDEPVDTPARDPDAGPAAVGRHRELAILDRELEGVSEGGSRAVLIEGEAGMGKTTLLDAWLAGAGTAGAVVLRGGGDELGAEWPLQPVLDGLVDHLRKIGTEAAAVVLGPQAGVLAPVLAAPGVVEDTGATRVGDAGALQASLGTALLAVIHRIGGTGPVVLVIDDAHLAGTATAAFCRLIRERGQRILVVAARRPGVGPDLPRDRTLALGPLDIDAVTRLVGAERAPALLARSGGHPLFLVELAAAPGGSGELPVSIRDAVAGRVHRLGERAAATLAAAAVLGPELDLDLLGTVLRTPVIDLLDQIEAAVGAGLLEDGGDSIGFRHELVRDALVAGTVAARRAWLHREAARVLVERPRHDDLAVARHARLGGDRQVATAALVRAAMATMARYDLAGAEGLLDDAIALEDRPATRLARSRVRLAGYDLAGAAADAQVALGSGAGAEGLELAGWIAYYGRHYDVAGRHAEEGAARADDGRVRVSCLALAGRVRHSQGDLEAADAHLARALELAPPEGRGLAQVWLSSLRAHQGRPAEGEELAMLGTLQPDRLDHPFAVFHGLTARAMSLGATGRIDDALAVVARGLDVTAEGGAQATRFRPVFLNTRSWLLRNVGLTAQAGAENEAALSSEGVSLLTGEPWHVAHLDLADGALASGDLEAADGWLRQAAALDTWTGTMGWHQRQRLGLLRARLGLAGGVDPHSVTALAMAVRDDAAGRGARRYELLAGSVVAQACAVGGAPVDHPQVDRMLHELEAVAATEAWWSTAQLAAITDTGRWWADAARAARLVASAAAAGLDAGPAVARRLDLIRSRRGR